jgi:hypothetical protein
VAGAHEIYHVVWCCVISISYQCMSCIVVIFRQNIVGLANNSNEVASDVSMIDRTDLTAGAIAVFDDIENMFHGLTNELNELLTQPE